MRFEAWYEESTKTNNRVFTAQEFYDDGYYNIVPYDDLDIDLITLTELKEMDNV